MKILLVNVHSARNAGDAVLLEMSLQLLRDRYPHAEIALALNDPDSHQGDERKIGSFSRWVKAYSEESSAWRLSGLVATPFYVWALLMVLLVWRVFGRIPPIPLPKAQRDLIQAYLEADLIASVAGNFLYSSGKIGLPFALAHLSMAFPMLAAKPVVMLPQTIGPILGWRDKRMIKWLFARLHNAFLRDELSREVLVACDADQSRVQVAPDIAFAYAASSQQAAADLLNAYGVDLAVPRPRIGMTLLNWGGLYAPFTGQQAYERAAVDLVRHFCAAHGGQVILFSQVQGPTQVEDDRQTAKRLFEMLSTDEQQHVVFIDRRVDAATLKAAYGLMDAFVGTRLHSNIFALSAMVPVVAIAYQPKTRGVLQLLDLAQWVVEIEGISAETLIEKFDTLWPQRHAVKGQLQEKMPDIIAQINAVSTAFPHV